MLHRRSARPGAAGRLQTLLALASLLTACGSNGGDAREAPGLPDATSDTLVRAVFDTILIEGQPEEIRLERFETPVGFPLPFTAWVPSDMSVQVIPADSGAAVRFTAEFGGIRRPDAFLNLFVHPASVQETEAVSLARAFAVSRGVPVSRGEAPEPEPAPSYAWSLAEYRFDGTAPGAAPVVGRVAVGRHGGRYFHIVQQFPPEYADGFGPRAHLLLERLRWADTGAGLGAHRDDRPG